MVYVSMKQRQQSTADISLVEQEGESPEPGQRCSPAQPGRRASDTSNPGCERHVGMTMSPIPRAITVYFLPLEVYLRDCSYIPKHRLPVGGKMLRSSISTQQTESPRVEKDSSNVLMP